MAELKRLTGENDEQYLWRIGNLIESGQAPHWRDISNIINEEFGLDEDDYRDESAYRKKYQAAKKFYENVFAEMNTDDRLIDVEKRISELQKERIRLQTVNLEKNRLNRNEVRQSLYYEYIAQAITTLPLPKFKELYNNKVSDMKYILTISDIHYGATFKSQNNEYSPEICKKRFEKLLSSTLNFIEQHKIDTLTVVSLGDTIQGILRISDVQLNDSSVVKTVVEACRIISTFLNNLSSVVNVEYYHVPSANHSQIRPLGTKASELANEDLEYIMGNYIKDSLSQNDRINVYLANEGDQYIDINVHNFNISAMHGHQIKNIGNSIKDLSVLRRRFVDYLLLGHYHSGKEIPCNEGSVYDTEVLISPSFIGSDPYSDSLMEGNKSAVKIYGFDKIFGHTETYKIILN